MSKIRSICVYCGSSNGKNPLYEEKAVLFGKYLAQADIALVYGGGNKGIMGAVARGVEENGGKITGIIPQFLLSKEASNADQDHMENMIITETMHQRKHLMFEKSDAFVTFPGGIGTLEEIVEMMTWAQLGHHTKPMVFANINQFWDPMFQLLDHMRNQGFIHTNNKVKPLIIENVDDIIPQILTHANHDDDGKDAIIEKL